MNRKAAKAGYGLAAYEGRGLLGNTALRAQGVRLNWKKTDMIFI